MGFTTSVSVNSNTAVSGGGIYSTVVLSPPVPAGVVKNIPTTSSTSRHRRGGAPRCDRWQFAHREHRPLPNENMRPAPGVVG